MTNDDQENETTITDNTRDLESEENWDFDQAEVHPPAKRNRAVVSVAFPRPAFEQVSRAAEIAGARVSEFIREAALEKASRQTEEAVLASVSGAVAGSISFNGRDSSGAPATTRVPGSPRIYEKATASRRSGSRAEIFSNQSTTV